MGIVLENFSKSFGDTHVIKNMNLEVADGEMLALLGPSGCGKSTTLFAIAGIHKVTAGRILFEGRDVTGLPSQARNVGIVFQSYALYPHMTVYQNIAFPLQIKKMVKAEIAKEVRAMARLVHIEELLERRPAELSGGQQQRVALARALVRRPDVLLLDEPLANLDARLRMEMRAEIRRIQLETGIVAILVTHDQVEAMSMCDRIAIMDKGEIVQIAAPEIMYDRPETAFVASFLGNPPVAFVDGVVEDNAVRLADSDLRLTLPHLDRVNGAGPSVRLGIRPEHFGAVGDMPVSGEIAFIETHGRESIYGIRLDNGATLRSVQAGGPEQGVGDRVDWFINAGKVMIFDAEGHRL